MLHRQLIDPLELSAVKYSAGRVAGRTEHDDLRFFTDEVLQGFHIDREIPLRQSTRSCTLCTFSDALPIVLLYTFTGLKFCSAYL